MNEIRILLVDDNEGDVFLTLEAFRESKMNATIVVARSGREALDYLEVQASSGEKSLPDLVLLDINMPGLSGIDVLDFIKSNEGLKSIPVIMLTTSDAASDIRTSYQHSANCFITKPLDFGKFLEVVDAIGSFWFSYAQLPRRAG